MMTKLVKGAVVGGIVFYLWSMLSWMLLPWHQWYTSAVPDEAGLAAALKTHIPTSGLYMVPWHDKNSNHQEVMQKMVAGPAAVMMIHPQGVSANMLPNMLWSFGVNCLMSLMATMLLLKTRGLNFVQKVGFVKTMGLSGALYVFFSNWNWWGYPLNYLLVNLVDQGIAWGLVGCALALFVVKD